MSFITNTLHWQETMNTVTVECSLDVAVHPAESDTVLLIIPGVDGSVHGYEDKYIRIAERMQDKYGVAVVRIGNPFISSFHWESNPRRILDYIASNISKITGSDRQPSIKVMAHSAGASIVARIAHEYDNITDLLLVNPAEKLGGDEIRSGLKKTNAKVTVVYGEKDPSVSFSEPLGDDGHTIVILDGVDHNFTDEHLQKFISLPMCYLF